MPPKVEATLRRHEAARTTDDPEYDAACHVIGTLKDRQSVNRSHLPFWEERDAYLAEVGAFLWSHD